MPTFFNTVWQIMRSPRPLYGGAFLWLQIVSLRPK